MFAGGVLIVGVFQFMVFRSLAMTGVVLLFGAVVLVPLVQKRRGRTGWELMIVRFAFWNAKRKGHNTFRGGVFGVVPGR